MAQSISVIIPAYNEEGNIKKAVQACLEVLPSLTDAFEIIVVNDGSKDGTKQMAEELARYAPSVKVYHHAFNKGMGAAVATGISHARHDLVFPIPADLQFDIKELRNFLPLIENSDIVIGYRVQRAGNLYRRFITFANHLLLRIFFGLTVRDPSWVKLFRRKIFDSISVTSSGFFWEAEVLIKAVRNHFRIKEVEAHSYQRMAGTSSGGKPSAAVKTFFTMIRFWLRQR